MCERCSTDEEPILAKIVHHIIYLTPFNINNPNISLNHDNLEALCQDCHNKEHHKKESLTNYKFDKDGNIFIIPPIKNN